MEGHGFPFLKQKAFPGQLAATALLAGVAGGTIVGGGALGIYFAAPEVTALLVQNGIIYVLGNYSTYKFIADFPVGFLPSPPPPSLGGYYGSGTRWVYEQWKLYQQQTNP